LLTSKASPNDSKIVIVVVIIVIGEVDLFLHRGADYSTEFGILARRFHPRGSDQKNGFEIFYRGLCTLIA
jgi:hypothetical protein